MNSRFLSGLWLLLALGALIFGLQAGPTVTEATPAGTTVLAPTAWIIPALVIILGLTGLNLVSADRPVVLARLLRRLRERPALFWFVILLYLTLAVGWWVYRAQPTNGRLLTPLELCYLCAAGWLFVFLIGYDMTSPTLRTMGGKLATSKATGLLLMLTTALVIFWGAEAYLRIFYITTDAYGFTAMNYWWYQNFYFKDLNSLGYRDYEPLPDEPGITRIAIVGDSFTAGHGISNIDETFPQALEKLLGQGYDVNTVAQSGWDSIDHTAWLNAYYENIAPRQPQVVVLSYYLNDIDYLLTGEADPNTAFDFLDLNTPGGWFVLNFFVPNYIYYNIAQFTQPARNTNFTDRLIRAHQDDAIWAQHEPYLQQFHQWCADHDARLIVMLWPQLAAIPQSQVALQRVSDFFAAQSNTTVVNLSPLLEAYPTRDLLVNRFDSHPSVLANRIAAEALYETIRAGE